MSDIDIPTATEVTSFVKARVAMLCNYRMCSGICGRRVLPSKDRQLCFQHYNRKNFMSKCIHDNCENGTMSHTGLCILHGQNKANMQIRRATDRDKIIQQPKMLPKHCDICNLNFTNIAMHNKTHKHLKNKFLHTLQYEYHNSVDSINNYTTLMEDIRKYYFNRKRIKNKK